MGSVSSPNPAITNLLQTISAAEPSILSSPSIVSSLENAPPADIIQISTAATQLAGLNAEFGIAPTPTDTEATDLNNVLTALTPWQTASSSTTTTQQLATYQAAVQEADTQSLLGTGTATGLSTPVFG
jgi:hypothetical protein